MRLKKNIAPIKTFENGERYAKSNLGIIDFKLNTSNKFYYKVGDKIPLLPIYDGRLLSRDGYIELTNQGELTEVVDLGNMTLKGGREEYDLKLKLQDGSTMVVNHMYYRLGFRMKE